jgi:hypothetical protein
VLTFTISIGREMSTLVTLGPNGGVPEHDRARRVRAGPGAAGTTADDVEALLRAAATGEHPTLARARSATVLGYLAGGLGTAAIVVGAVVRSACGRRRRTAERV